MAINVLSIKAVSSRKIIRKFLGILFVGFILGAIGAFLLSVPRYYSLVRRAQPALGTVKSKERENHMAVWFEYAVDERLYQSAGRAEDVGKSFDAIQVGEAVQVYFDSSNPSSATIGDPSRYLYSSIRGTLFVIVGYVFCILIYFLRWKSWKVSPANASP